MLRKNIAARMFVWGIISVVLIMMIFAGSEAGAEDLVTYVEDKLLEPEEETEIRVFIQDEGGELLEIDAEVLARLDGMGLIADSEQEAMLEMLAGELDFIYRAPARKNREQLFLFEPGTGLGDDLSFRVVENREENTRELAAEIVQIVGDVLIQKEAEEDWQPAHIGAELMEGDAVQTLADSRVKLTTFDDAEIMIEPETTVEFLELETIEERREVKRARLQLMDGEVVARVRELLNRGSRFTIETDSVTAGVRGTAFRMRYDSEADITEIFAYSGEIKVTNEILREAYLLRRGEQVYFESPEDSAQLEDYENTLSSDEDLEEVSVLEGVAEEDIIEEPVIPEEETEDEADDYDDEEEEDDEEGHDDKFPEDDEGDMEIDPEW